MSSTPDTQSAPQSAQIPPTVSTSSSGGASVVLTVTPAPTQPAAAAPSPRPVAPVTQMLASAFAAVRSKVAVATELAAAQAQIASLTTERDAARTELATANNTIAQIGAQISGVAEFFGISAADLVGKSVADCQALLRTKISNETTEQIAALGFPSASLPAQAKENATDTPAELLRQFNAITDSAERAAFYEKNKNVMFSGKN